MKLSEKLEKYELSKLGERFLFILVFIMIIILLFAYGYSNSPPKCNARFNPIPLRMQHPVKCREWISSNCMYNVTKSYCTTEISSNEELQDLLKQRYN